MNHLTSRFFDSIARAIYSHGLVTAVMLFVITYMTLFSHTLFLQILPSSMSAWERDTSAWLMAIGWDLTLLVTMGNPKHIHPSVPWIGAVASGIIVLFFFHAFDGLVGRENLLMVQRWFAGTLAAIIAFIYTSLFHAKWNERNDLVELPAKLIETERNLVQTQSQLELTQKKLIHGESTLDEYRSLLNQRDRELDQLRSRLDEFLKELTCPHCGVIQANPRALNAHKGHCEKNPKKLNGSTLKQIA